MAVERLAADQRVFALLELEAQEVGGRNELRLARLLQDGVDVAGGTGIGGRRGAAVAGFDEDSRRRDGDLAALATLVAFLLALEIIGFVLPALLLANRDAVRFHRAADEEPVADVPRVVAALAPDRQPARAAKINCFVLVQHETQSFLFVLSCFRGSTMILQTILNGP